MSDQQQQHVASSAGFSTNAVHQGQTPEANFGAVVPPIYMTSTYAQPWPAVDKGYDYTRAGNPNFTNLEVQLASLEKAQYAVSFASGLSVFTALCSGLPQGTAVAALSSAYGGTYRLLSRVLVPQGVDLALAQFGDWNALENIFAEKKPKYFFYETPTNPLLEVIDIRAISALAKKYQVVTICDNTFMSPYLQNPLTLGADVVMHSVTKYIGGHSDVIGGVLLTNNKEIADRAKFMRLCLGLNSSPMDAWLVTRSIKTLALRMQRHSENAMKVAKFLENHRLVEKVLYPGLESHPQHELQKSMLVDEKRGYSGMISAELKLSLKQTQYMLTRCRVFILAESLGGVESLIEQPASMTHASIPAEERRKIGLADGLVRLSCGVEDAEDLIADLESAIEEASKMTDEQVDAYVSQLVKA